MFERQIELPADGYSANLQAAASRSWMRLELALEAANRFLLVRRNVTLVLFLATAAVVALRMPAALARPAGGIDYGHYLSTFHWLTGQEPTQFSNHGLFGFHLLLVVLIPIFGEATATAISGPLVAGLLVLGAYVLARRVLPPLAALACGGLLGCSQGFSEMMAWGGNPNMLAMTFSMVAWSYYIDTAERRNAGSPWRSAAVLAGIFTGLTLLTHFFTAFILLVTALAFLLSGGAFGFFNLRKMGVPIGVAAVVALVVALPGAPQYFALASEGSLAVGASGAENIEQLADGMAYLHRDTPLLWAGALMGAAIATVLLARRRSIFGLYLASAMLVPLLLAATVLSAHASRTLYFLEIPMIVGLGVLLHALWTHKEKLPSILRGVRRPAVFAIAVAFLVLVPPSSAAREDAAIEYYNHLTVDHLAALDWINTHAAREDAVWTAGSFSVDSDGRAGATYGFWIEGYARQPALYTARPEDLAFASQQAAARDACRVLQGDKVAENGLLRVGTPHTLASGSVPTVGILAGRDYRMIVYGADIGLEAGARLFRLSSGVLGAESTASIEGETARMQSRAGFSAPNNWSANVSASTVLAGATVTYLVEVSGAASARPWIHEDFVLAQGAVFVGNETSQNGSVQTFRYMLPATAVAPEARFSLRFHAEEPASVLNVARYGADSGGSLRVLVSGRAVAPLLELAVTWENAPVVQAEDLQVRLFGAPELLSLHAVRFLLVDAGATQVARRFDGQPERYVRVFETPSVLVFEVRPAT